MATGTRKTAHEGRLAAEAGLHINQNPYSTKNWKDSDLRELSAKQLRTLYNKATHWNNGYRKAKLNLKNHDKESGVSV